MRGLRLSNPEDLRKVTTCDAQADFLLANGGRDAAGALVLRESDRCWQEAVARWGTIGKLNGLPDGPREPKSSVYLALSALPMSSLPQTLEATVQVMGLEKVKGWAEDMLKKDCKCTLQKAYAREVLKLLP